MRNVNSCDSTILTQLNSGALLADPDTGDVYRFGKKATATQSNGYLQVHIGNGRRALCHRVVWLAVHGYIPEDMEVNHLNGQRTDNRLANLELATHSENILHAKRGKALEHVRPDDMASVDPGWLAEVMALAESGSVTRDQVATLRE